MQHLERSVVEEILVADGKAAEVMATQGAHLSDARCRSGSAEPPQRRPLRQEEVRGVEDRDVDVVEIVVEGGELGGLSGPSHALPASARDVV